MILRLLLMVLFAIPLSASAAQENKKIANGAEILDYQACSTCSCRQPPSAADLMQSMQVILSNNMLLVPQVEALLIPQMQQLITTGGIGVVGATGPAGPAGPAGATGATGATGAAGGVLDFADFFALMPPNNASTVAAGGDVDFPQDGPTSGSGLIVRTGADSFNLAEIGVYQVLFQVSVSEPGQLVLTLDSGAGAQELAYTVVGRATGSSQIVGMALVQTSVINSILTVRNPATESTALTITPLAGGTEPVSAHLVITRIR